MYFDANMPAPRPDFDDKEFWLNCDMKRLAFQHCASCGSARHPPTPVCPQCLSLKSEWRQTLGIGQVFTYTVAHHPSHDAVQRRLPYVIAVLVFDDAPGVRLVSNITDVSPERVRIGMRVQLWWDQLEDGHLIPRFRPVG